MSIDRPTPPFIAKDDLSTLRSFLQESWIQSLQITSVVTLSQSDPVVTFFEPDVIFPTGRARGDRAAAGKTEVGCAYACSCGPNVANNTCRSIKRIVIYITAVGATNIPVTILV